MIINYVQCKIQKDFVILVSKYHHGMKHNKYLFKFDQISKKIKAISIYVKTYKHTANCGTSVPSIPESNPFILSLSLLNLLNKFVTDGSNVFGGIISAL